MPVPQFPDEFDPSSSLLFLGSGFSADATNSAGRNPPVGRGLAQILLKHLGMDEGSDYDLKDLATHAAKAGVDLNALLTDQFTIKALTDDHRTILAQPWRRIYTTNYDDAAEWYSRDAKLEPRPQSYSFEDQLPTRVLPRTNVHLHGYIHRCTKENVLSQLVLTHYSYAEQAAKRSPWWAQFERDLRTAEGIFFIGYSLNDFAVASYLTKSIFASKCHFILRRSPDPITTSRIADYGLLHPIAVSGFAEKCKAAVPRQALRHPNALRAFRYFDPQKDNKAPLKPTPLEIDALMTLGNFKLQRLLSTFPEASYVAPRSDSLDSALGLLGKSRTLVLHSKIGNGKTIFRQCLSMRLSELGHTCFECRDDVTIPEREVEYLRVQKKPVVFFPTYDTAYATLDQLSGLPDVARFIVEMNTGTLQVRGAEVHSRLMGPVGRLDLNRLARQDLNDLWFLLDRAGIAPTDINLRFGQGAAEMRDIVLSLYDNREVGGRIKKLLSPMLADADFKRVLYCSIILRSLDLKVDPGFLRAVTKVDPFQALSKFTEGSLDIMAFDLDRVEPHSALFSEYLIRHYVDPRELIDWIYWLCAEAASRMNEDGNLQSARSRDARHALGTLLTHSHLREFLDRCNNRDELIKDLYERGRSNSAINAEPLFWLQYSIFMQFQEEWDVAEKHMETAYERSTQRRGFQTFQLDTNSLGLFLELERRDTTSPVVTRFEKIAVRLEKVREMLTVGNHRGYALRVLTGVEGFVRARRRALSTSEATRLTYLIHLLIDTLGAYEIGLRTETGSDQTKQSLQRALDALLRPA